MNNFFRKLDSTTAPGSHQFSQLQQGSDNADSSIRSNPSSTSDVFRPDRHPPAVSLSSGFPSPYQHQKSSDVDRSEYLVDKQFDLRRSIEAILQQNKDNEKVIPVPVGAGNQSKLYSKQDAQSRVSSFSSECGKDTAAVNNGKEQISSVLPPFLMDTISRMQERHTPTSSVADNSTKFTMVTSSSKMDIDERQQFVSSSSSSRQPTPTSKPPYEPITLSSTDNDDDRQQKINKILEMLEKAKKERATAAATAAAADEVKKEASDVDLRNRKDSNDNMQQSLASSRSDASSSASTFMADSNKKPTDCKELETESENLVDLLQALSSYANEYKTEDSMWKALDLNALVNENEKNMNVVDNKARDVDQCQIKTFQEQQAYFNEQKMKEIFQKQHQQHQQEQEQQQVFYNEQRLKEMLLKQQQEKQRAYLNEQKIKDFIQQQQQQMSTFQMYSQAEQKAKERSTSPTIDFEKYEKMKFQRFMEIEQQFRIQEANSSGEDLLNQLKESDASKRQCNEQMDRLNLELRNLKKQHGIMCRMAQKKNCLAGEDLASLEQNCRQQNDVETRIGALLVEKKKHESRYGMVRAKLKKIGLEPPASDEKAPKADSEDPADRLTSVSAPTGTTDKSNVTSESNEPSSSSVSLSAIIQRVGSLLNASRNLSNAAPTERETKVQLVPESTSSKTDKPIGGNNDDKPSQGAKQQEHPSRRVKPNKKRPRSESSSSSSSSSSESSSSSSSSSSYESKTRSSAKASQKKGSAKRPAKKGASPKKLPKKSSVKQKTSKKKKSTHKDHATLLSETPSRADEGVAQMPQVAAVSDAPNSGQDQCKELDQRGEDRFLFYDGGSHWCRTCNITCSTLYEIFDHVHSTKHKNAFTSRPWMDSSPPKRGPNPGINTKVLPIKGIEFLVGCQAFYCSLCDDFAGDAACAESHFKSTKHYEKYEEFVSKNTLHEKCLSLEKAAKMGQPAVLQQSDSKVQGFKSAMVPRPPSTTVSVSSQKVPNVPPVSGKVQPFKLKPKDKASAGSLSSTAQPSAVDQLSDKCGNAAIFENSCLVMDLSSHFPNVISVNKSSPDQQKNTGQVHRYSQNYIPPPTDPQQMYGPHLSPVDRSQKTYGPRLDASDRKSIETINKSGSSHTRDSLDKRTPPSSYTSSTAKNKNLNENASRRMDSNYRRDNDDGGRSSRRSSSSSPRSTEGVRSNARSPTSSFRSRPPLFGTRGFFIPPLRRGGRGNHFRGRPFYPNRFK